MSVAEVSACVTGGSDGALCQLAGATLSAYVDTRRPTLNDVIASATEQLHR